MIYAMNVINGVRLYNIDFAVHDSYAPISASSDEASVMEVERRDCIIQF
jgi:hypothetical protein